MVILSRITILFCLLLGHGIHAQENRASQDEFRTVMDQDEVENLLLEYVDLVKSNKEAQERLDQFYALVEIEGDSEDICVSCDVIASAAGDVGSVLDFIAKESKDDELLSEVGRLRAMKYIIANIDENSKQNCVANYLGEDPREVNANIRNSTLIFSKSVPMETLTQFNLRSYNAGTVAFLRGTGSDRDKFYKVTIPIEGDPIISKYQLHFIDPSEEEIASATQRTNRAMDVDYSSDGLPKKIIVLDVHDNLNLGPVNIESDLEISTSRQRAIFRFQDSNNNEYFNTKISADGDVKLGVPLSYGLQGSSYYLNGEAFINSNGAKGFGFRLNSHGSELVSGSVSRDNGRTSYDIGHRRFISETEVLSFRLRKNENESAFWINYAIRY